MNLEDVYNKINRDIIIDKYKKDFDILINLEIKYHTKR